MYLEIHSIFGKFGLKRMTTDYEIREWPRDFFEVTVIALKRKPKATRCSIEQR